MCKDGSGATCRRRHWPTTLRPDSLSLSSMEFFRMYPCLSTAHALKHVMAHEGIAVAGG